MRVWVPSIFINIRIVEAVVDYDGLVTGSRHSIISFHGEIPGIKYVAFLVNVRYRYDGCVWCHSQSILWNSWVTTSCNDRGRLGSVGQDNSVVLVIAEFTGQAYELSCFRYVGVPPLCPVLKGVPVQHTVPL